MIANALKRSDGNINYPGLIAAWSAKGKTNDDEDRAILKDLTGNGHDITLNGFAFSKMSGYGGYNYQFNKSYYMVTSSASYIETNNKIIITAKDKIDLRVTKSDSAYTWNEYKINIKGLLEGDYIDIYGYYDNTKESAFKIDNNGIHIIPKSLKTDGLSGGYTNFIRGAVTKPATIEIEILPKYPDALVFDGVDDYGICPQINSNLFTEFTFICKRSYVTNPNIGKNTITANCVSTSNNKNIFSFEGFYQTSYISVYNNNTLSVSGILIDYSLQTTFLTPINYNGINFKNGGDNNYNENAKLNIGRLYNGSRYSNIAFYSAYLFDRSLDEQEIKAFIRKYIDPEYLLPSEILTPDCYYDFSKGSNDDETRDTIKDYSGNGNDAVAHNFAWNEDGSGYKDGALVFDGVDDYISLDAFDSGFKTMFMVCNPKNKSNAFLYDQRKNSKPPYDYELYTYNSVAYNMRNANGTYINGIKNTKVFTKDLNNKKILISVNSELTQLNKPTVGTGITGSYSDMALYKFLGFKEALTEEQIQTVIKKYNLLDGVDEIEVS